MKADHFVLSIDLGNDAMQRWSDISYALRKLADEIEWTSYPDDNEQGTIRDLNGNRVGGWHTSTGPVR